MLNNVVTAPFLCEFSGFFEHLCFPYARAADDKISATLDTVIICTSRLKELADFYQQGLQLQNPKSQGDNHLGFQLPKIYLGFDKVDTDQFTHPRAISYGTILPVPCMCMPNRLYSS